MDRSGILVDSKSEEGFASLGGKIPSTSVLPYRRAFRLPGYGSRRVSSRLRNVPRRSARRFMSRKKTGPRIKMWIVESHYFPQQSVRQSASSHLILSWDSQRIGSETASSPPVPASNPNAVPSLGPHPARRINEMSLGESGVSKLYSGQTVSSEGFTQKNDCGCSNRKLPQWRGSPHMAVDKIVAVGTLDFLATQ